MLVAFRLPERRFMPASEMAVIQTQMQSLQIELPSSQLVGTEENRLQAAYSSP